MGHEEVAFSSLRNSRGGGDLSRHEAYNVPIDTHKFGQVVV